MRTPSRQMPKFLPRKASLWAWIAVAIMLIGFFLVVVDALLASTRFTLLGAIALLGLFSVAHYEIKRDERKLHALASARRGESICEFVRDFDCRSVDTWVVRAVYEQLQRQLRHIHPSFPIRAEDRLKEDLLLDDDDLDLDVVQEVGFRTGRRLERVTENPYFGKVKTVRDLVLFFQCQPTREGRPNSSLNSDHSLNGG